MSNKYPKTICDAGRQGFVFAVNSNVRPLPEKDYGETPPMKGFSGWSSYQLNFSDSEKKTGGNGNIEITHVADVKARTNCMIPLIMKEEAKKNAGIQNGGSGALIESLNEKIAFLPSSMSADKGATALVLANKYSPTQCREAVDNLKANAQKGGKYATSNEKQARALSRACAAVAGKHVITADGEYKGRTVAEIFTEDMTKAAAYTGVLQKSDSEDYQYCNAVFRMLKDDKNDIEYLSIESTAAESTRYVIYSPVLKTPNISDVDENGYTKAYELAVYCDPTHLPYPFKIQLTTMKGKPIKNQKVGIQGGTITDRQSFSIDLTSWEWMNMVDRMDWEKNLVLLFSHKQQFEAMERFDAENRKK